MRLGCHIYHICVFFALFWSPGHDLFGANTQGSSAEDINLALRRTADKLLRASGDSTSRIPAVVQTGEQVWRIDLNQQFLYDSLPSLLQSSLDLFGIREEYKVAVRKCEDDVIDLGFHQQDFLFGGQVPCMERESPEGCHYLEITFAGIPGNRRSGFGITAGSMLALLLIAGIALVWWLGRRKPESAADNTKSDEWLSFGRSRLHATGNVVECSGVRQDLTYREAKLLKLFIAHPDELLERDVILQQVWADEGVRVGRSIDVFVSRLRKKLKPDPTVGIVAVHGMGYRLVTKQV